MRTTTARWGGAWALFAVIGAAALAGCGDRRPAGAIGPNDEISVFTNVPDDHPAVAALRTTYAYDIDVVSREAAFYLDFVSIDRYAEHRTVKNQIFFVDMSRDDALTRRVPSFLGREGRRELAAGRPVHRLVPDHHAFGQTTLFLIGRSAEELLAMVGPAAAAENRREFEGAVGAGLVKTIFAAGEEIELSRRLGRDFGWTIRLPRGFSAAQDPSRRYLRAGAVRASGGPPPQVIAGAASPPGETAAGGFVKLSSESPVRLILVHWRDELLEPGPAAWDPVLDGILWHYNDGDFVQRDRTSASIRPFQGTPAVRWEGLWQNEKYVIGGPLRAWAFTRGGRSWLLVEIVYNPGQDKVPPLRQIDAILTTFEVLG